MGFQLLPQTSEYALRAMVCLVAQPCQCGLRAKDLAEAANVPLAYMSKVLRKLVLSGLLTGQKGHHGGFLLARKPEEIRFIDVLVATDFRVDTDSCSFGWGSCDHGHPCPLHQAHLELKQEFLRWAETQTLANLDIEHLSRLLAGTRAGR